MKKTYIIPHVSISEIQQELPLAGSQDGSVNSNIEEIGYGGIDEEGELEPSVKEDFFDFEWE